MASTTKEQVARMIAELPDDVTMSDIQYHLYVRQKVENSMRAVSEGRVYTQAEVDAEMKQWLKSSVGQR